jgi:imidazolonepropionase-like amidohydrolase
MNLRTSRLLRRFGALFVIALGVARGVASAADAPAPPATIAIVGATVINPGTAQILENAVIVIAGDRVTAVGAASSTKVPAGATIINAKGRWIVPGFIDTHVHFFQSGGLYTRPDAIDLTKVRPYADEVAMVKSRLPDAFARYLRSGVTSVIDIGGPLWNFEMRRIAGETKLAPRVAAAGPLISSVARPQLDLGDPPIVKITTPEEGRALVRKLAEQKPDYIKIWYIVDGDGAVERFRPIIQAVMEESRQHHLRVAVHATELEAARASVEEGADLLVHSVTDQEVDDRFIKLLLEKGTIVTPTLVVFERYARTFAGQLNLNAEELAWGDPAVISTLFDLAHLPADQVPERIRTATANPKFVETRLAPQRMALLNLKKLQDAGVRIAAGTDAGNIGTIHGPAIFREFALMSEAGLTPMQILTAATSNAAKAFGLDAKIGSLEPGYFADLVVLRSNPLLDITRASEIESVMKGGVMYAAASLAPDSAADVVQRQVNAFNAHNLDALLATYAEDVKLYDFPDQLLATGRAALRAHYEKQLGPDSKAHWEIRKRLVAGNVIIDEVRWTGRADGKNSEGVGIYQVRNGLIQSIRAVPSKPAAN